MCSDALSCLLFFLLFLLLFATFSTYLLTIYLFTIYYDSRERFLPALGSFIRAFRGINNHGAEWLIGCQEDQCLQACSSK